MGRVAFDMETEVSPERVIGALTDFTERRPDLWPSLKREEYEVYEQGATNARVREGSSGSIWAVERYEWSDPGVVRWEVEKSGFCRPGSFVQTEVHARDGGGTRIHVTWERHPSTFLARLILGMIVLARGAPVRSSIRKGLERIAADEVS